MLMETVTATAMAMGMVSVTPPRHSAAFRAIQQTQWR
jgi:hypothetical protein